VYIGIDHRRFQRVNLPGELAVFVDLGCYYKGELKDVSYDGFRVVFPSLIFSSIFWPTFSVFFSAMIWRVRKFRIVICTSGNSSNRTGKNFLISAYPRWMKKKDTRLEIGFKIPESSAGWQFFVHQKIAEKEQDFFPAEATGRS